MTATTTKKTASHVTITYALAVAAATLVVAAIQSLSHNALSVVEGGALTTVLAEGAVMALRATGQVDVPDAPQVPALPAITAEDVSAAVTAAVSAALAPKPASETTAVEAVPAAPRPEPGQ